LTLKSFIYLYKLPVHTREDLKQEEQASWVQLQGSNDLWARVSEWTVEW
jgi:hypothetical protein